MKTNNQLKCDKLIAKYSPSQLKSKLIQLDYELWRAIPRDAQQQLLNWAYSEG